MIEVNVIKASFIYFMNSLANVFSGIFSRLFVSKETDFLIPIFTLLFLRSLTSLIILSPFFIKNIKYVKKSIISNVVISFFTATDVFLFNFGLKGTTINQAILIMLLIPIWINVFSGLILKEYSRRIENFVVLIFCFIALFISNEELNPYFIYKNYNLSNFNFYPILIVINTFFVASSLMLQKKFKEDRPIMFGLFCNNLALFLMTFVLKEDIFKYINFYHISLAVVLSILDIIEFGAAYKAYSMCEVSILQPIRFTRVVISSLFGYLILNETTSLNQIIGISIIILLNLINPLINSIKNKKN